MTAPLDIRPLLDPAIADSLAAFPMDLGALSDELLPLIRSGMGASTDAVELSDRVLRTDHEIPDADGVTVRVHRPADVEGPLPCVYWMHGGGYVLGSNTMDDARFDRWCTMYPCVGVSVEYRLAPETPFPGPLHDAYAGLVWTRDNAAALGIDTGRLGIGGASAGAGLAAGLGLYARDQSEVELAFQLLIYPMIDDRQATPSSQWNDPIWPPAANTYGWKAYLGDLYGGDVPIYAAPARAEDLTGLPPTLIVVGALDGFCDEDIQFAVRLRHAGVPTELHVYPGAPHGFDGIFAHTTIAQRANADVEAWLSTMIC